MQRIGLFLIFLTALTMQSAGADRYSVANGNWGQVSTWSETSGGSPGASVPGASDNVFIEGGFTVTMNAAATTSNVTIKSGSTLDAASYKLIVGSVFTVENGGTFKQGGSEVSVPGATKSLASNSTYIFYGTQAGLSGTFPNYGNLIFQPSPTGPGTFAGNLNVAGNLTINLGTVQEIRFATGSTSRSHSITGNLVVGGSGIVVGNNGTTASANISVGGNLLVSEGTLRGTNSAGNAIFNITGDITNNGTWQLDDGSSTGIFSIVLNGSSAGQTIDGTSEISFENLTINNSSGVILGRDITVNGCLSMIDGSVSSGDNILSYGSDASLSYDGASYTITSGSEFPLTNGPANLNINLCNAAGISLHANRILSGNLTVAPGNIFRIPAGLQLTVNGTTTTNGGLVLKSPVNNGPAGSFIANGSVSGNVTVERFFNSWSAYYGWHFLSSPVLSQAIQPEFVPDPPTSSEDFYKWDETTNLWINSKSSPGTWNTGFENNFSDGRGYLVAYQNAATREFTGIPATSNVAISGLTLSSGTNNGWHLLGNPFPSAVEWNGTDWNLTNIASTAKIWVESSASYVDIHEADHDIIPAMNGFMVQVTTAPGSLMIPASARTHDGTSWYKNSMESIRLTVRETEFGTSQETEIRINQASTDGYDAAFDSRFLAGYAPQFFSIAGNEHLSTNTLPDLSNNRIIQLGFIKNDASYYSIELDTTDLIPGIGVYMTDKKKNMVQDLVENPVYFFDSDEGADPARFQLRFINPFGTDEPYKANTVAIYPHNGSIYVSNKTDGIIRGDVFVYNTAGELLLHSLLSDGKLTVLHLKPNTYGYFVVKVITSEQVYTGKVLLQ